MKIDVSTQTAVTVGIIGLTVIAVVYMTTRRDVHVPERLVKEVEQIEHGWGGRVEGRTITRDYANGETKPSE